MGCLIEFLGELLLEVAFSREHLTNQLSEQEIRNFRRWHIFAAILFSFALVTCLFVALTTPETWMLILALVCLWLIVRHINNIHRLNEMRGE